ncbi:hypothetical protein K438DRAFT_1790261 [Mycena galopus ATCC 62051]|nr:hypothetical protein K438DRAFT_1790261 [Mycena galopus ATCC 62051]
MGRSPQSLISPSKSKFLKALNAPPTATTVSVDAMLILLMVFLNSGGRTDRLGARPNGRDNAVERTKIGWTSIGKYLMQKSSSAGGPIPPERVIHIELKRLGAWNGRTHCPYCGREHQENSIYSNAGARRACLLNTENLASEDQPVKISVSQSFNAPPTPTDGVGGCYAYLLMVFSNSGGRTAPSAHGRMAETMPRRGPRLDGLYGKYLMQKSSSAGGPIPPERVIHIELKRLGAWNGRTHCPYCGREHQEKFDLLKCGGKAGLVRIVEARLTALGWTWKRSALHSQLPRHTYTSQGLFLVFNVPAHSNVSACRSIQFFSLHNPIPGFHENVNAM